MKFELERHLHIEGCFDHSKLEIFCHMTFMITTDFSLFKTFIIFNKWTQSKKLCLGAYLQEDFSSNKRR